MINCIIREKGDGLLLVNVDSESSTPLNDFTFEVVNGAWYGTFKDGNVTVHTTGSIIKDCEVLFWDADFLYKKASRYYNERGSYNEVLDTVLEKIQNNDFTFKCRDYDAHDLDDNIPF